MEAQSWKAITTALVQQFEGNLYIMAYVFILSQPFAQEVLSRLLQQASI